MNTRTQLDVVSYRPRPFRALVLFYLGFMVGGGLIPDYLKVRHQYSARISCQQHHPLPAPIARPQ